MECSVCDIRSSIGYCIECQQLLCETCSETCDACGKLMCPEHVNESRSGKVYCKTCNDRRKAERAAKHGRPRHDDTAVAGTSLESLAGVPAVEAEERDEEARVLGKRETVQPWQLCLYSAVVALVLAIILLVFPTLRRIPLGGTSYLATPYPLLIVPLVSTFWGVYGVVNIEFYKHRQRCMAGLGIAVLSMVMFVIEVSRDPATLQDDDSLELQQRRQNMAPEQLDGWRENVLDKYK